MSAGNLNEGELTDAGSGGAAAAGIIELEHELQEDTAAHETLGRTRSETSSAGGSERSLKFQADERSLKFQADERSLKFQADERHHNHYYSTASCHHPSRTEGRYGWPTRIGFGVSIGAWLTGLLWMVLRSPLLAVFLTGVALGLCILENCWLSEVTRARADEIAELEKQVVVLRSTIHGMSLYNHGLEAEHRRAAFRGRLSRGLSVSSL
jgi:hypothetical protein